MSDAPIHLGLGIYERTDAARLLGISPARLYRWVGGYTYWLRRHPAAKDRRRQPPVIKTDLPPIEGSVALSFLELMELRVVKAILDQGLSLQHVRKAARVAAERFGTEHPFASRRVFTDGQAIFSAFAVDNSAQDLVRWERGRIDQLISGALSEQFLQEIDFDSRTSLAFRWWPKGRSKPIVLDPKISFGAPVIEGTAVRTYVIASMASHASANEAAVAFELELRKVEAAVEFEAELAAA